MSNGKIRLWYGGDLNAFFGLGTNVLVNLIVLTSLLLYVVQMPADIVFGRILPAVGLMLLITNLYFAFMASLFLSLLGLLTGIWADKFDHVAAITNFVITPLAFLSGTFYSIERLPGAWNDIAHFNPFFYMIDGFRYGFIGHSDAPVWQGMAVLFGLNATLWWLCHRLFAKGYKLKT